MLRPSSGSPSIQVDSCLRRSLHGQTSGAGNVEVVWAHREHGRHEAGDEGLQRITKGNANSNKPTGPYEAVCVN